MNKTQWKSADTISQAEPFKNLLFLISHRTQEKEVLSGNMQNGKPITHRQTMGGEIIGWIYDKDLIPT